ncbi:MAG: erythromycin esterase family protein [Bacteroidota bacterium]
MKNIRLILGILFSVSILSCAKESIVESEEELTELLTLELNPLKSSPLLWEDTELQHLDRFGKKQIVGLGEATHGTSEFFDAKHRIFKYLVENHGFKVFAFEADFGESILINEAIQKGDCGQIRSLMKSKMHFWTWQTTEVEQLLTWMCNYNVSKDKGEKLQYYGVDCSFNTFHPDLVLTYLENAEVEFLEVAKQILTTAKESSENSFQTYDGDSFQEYLQEVSTLQDSMDKHRDFLVEKSSEKEFELNRRLVSVIGQASEIRRLFSIGNFENDPRDSRMADNALWLLEHFEGEKIALWAHNGHLDKNEEHKSMGYYLSQDLGANYGSIGFSFSKGSFRAIGQGGLKVHSLEADPKLNSLNFYLTQANQSQFSVNLNDLFKNSAWKEKEALGLDYLYIGAVFNSPPENYYSKFESTYFDELIYFDKTNTAQGF